MRSPSITVVAPDALAPAEIEAWRGFQRQDIVLGSPFLSPEFVRIAATLRPGVQVAVARQEGRPVGFLPFERRGDAGGPVGGALSDCQAMIAAPGWSWDARALVRAAGLAVLDFTWLRAAQLPFAPFHRSISTSHAVDLSDGFEAYVRQRREAGQQMTGGSSGLPHHALQRARKLERQLGPLRFAMHEADPAALRQVIAWKREQYRATGVPDAFARRWTVALLERIHATREDDFAGMLSTLSVGGRIIAAHMGMRAGAVLHWWFPAYDAAHARHSPGTILFLGICREAAAHGIRMIELGPGDEPYKLLLANAGIPVASGYVAAAPSLSALGRRARYGVEQAAARMPIGRHAQLPARLFRWLEMTLRLR